PPRQRAVLLLCDVLGWSAPETARLLDASVASVNSGLQRARQTLGRRFPSGRPPALPAPDDRQRALLERYVRAWESVDLDGFVALLKEDATLNMPPMREWYRGRAAMRAFFAWAWPAAGGGPFRLVATGANRQPAFALYRPGAAGYEPHGIWVLALHDDAIASVTGFFDPRLFAAFGLPAALPVEIATPSASRCRRYPLHRLLPCRSPAR